MVLAPLIRLRGSDGVLLGSMPLRVLLCCCDVFIMRPLTVKVNNNLSILAVCDILIASILGISAKPKLAKVIRASDRQNRVDADLSRGTQPQGLSGKAYWRVKRG